MIKRSLVVGASFGLLLTLPLGCTKTTEEAPADPVPTSSPDSSAMRGPDGMETGGAKIVPATYMASRMEVGCAMCTYGLPTNSCVTAAMVDGTPLVIHGEGTEAHGMGLCTESETPRFALVTGNVVDGHLEVTAFDFQSADDTETP